MKMRSAARDHFRLERLETRTLLAADLADPFGLTTDLTIAMQAVSGTGSFDGSFVTNFGNHRLVLTGSPTSTLTIDLDLLPSFVTSLQISSFGEVKMVGRDHVDNLIVTNVESLNASGLDITGATTTRNVHSLVVNSLGVDAVLSGDTMALTAQGLDNTTIYSHVRNLTVTSHSRAIQYIAVPDPDAPIDHILNLTYEPEIVGISGIPKSSVHVVLPGVGAAGDLASSGPGSGSTVSTPDTSTRVQVDDAGGGNPSVVITDPSGIDIPIVSSSPGINTSSAGHLVIVSLPLDERTRAVLDQLRDLLHSTRSDSDQLVLNLLRHSVPLTTASNPAGGELARSWPINVGALAASVHPTSAAVGIVDPMAELPVGFAPIMLNGDATEVEPLQLFPTNTAGTYPTLPIMVPEVPNILVSWPAAGSLPLPSVSSNGEFNKSASSISPTTVLDNVRTFGTYLVERVSAEFVPGHQSLVLLVDPQPTGRNAVVRKAANARESIKTSVPFVTTFDVLTV